MYIKVQAKKNARSQVEEKEFMGVREATAYAKRLSAEGYYLVNVVDSMGRTAPGFPLTRSDDQFDE